MKRVSGSFSVFFSRFFWASFERWNQHLTKRAPSFASDSSKKAMRASSASNRAPPIFPVVLFRIGSVYQEPKKTPILPRAGSVRQKRHAAGRSRSSSLRGPKTFVSTPRGSSHSRSRLTVSPLPEPSAPAMTTITGTFVVRSASCAARRRARIAGSSAAYSSFESRRPSSAVSNTCSSRPWPRGRDARRGGERSTARRNGSRRSDEPRGRQALASSILSFSAWKWATSGSISSSSLPSRTSPSRCEVKPIRWSVTRDWGKL